MPLLRFIECMYPCEGEPTYPSLDPLITKIEDNLQEKYDVMMLRKEDIERNQKGPQQHKRMMREEEERMQQRGEREKDRDRGRERDRDRERERDKGRDRDDS